MARARPEARFPAEWEPHEATWIEVLERGEEIGPGRLAFHHEVVAGLQWHETRARNQRRNQSAFLEWNGEISPRVQYERGANHARGIGPQFEQEVEQLLELVTQYIVIIVAPRVA